MQSSSQVQSRKRTIMVPSLNPRSTPTTATHPGGANQGHGNSLPTPAHQYNSKQHYQQLRHPVPTRPHFSFNPASPYPGDGGVASDEYTSQRSTTHVQSSHDGSQLFITAGTTRTVTTTTITTTTTIPPIIFPPVSENKRNNPRRYPLAAMQIPPTLVEFAAKEDDAGVVPMLVSDDEDASSYHDGSRDYSDVMDTFAMGDSLKKRQASPLSGGPVDDGALHPHRVLTPQYVTDDPTQGVSGSGHARRPGRSAATSALSLHHHHHHHHQQQQQQQQQQPQLQRHFQQVAGASAAMHTCQLSPTTSLKPTKRAKPRDEAAPHHASRTGFLEDDVALVDSGLEETPDNVQETTMMDLADCAMIPPAGTHQHGLALVHDADEGDNDSAESHDDGSDSEGNEAPLPSPLMSPKPQSIEFMEGDEADVDDDQATPSARMPDQGMLYTPSS
ncbi:hypothetical protein EV182_003697, partial [Spiromyces aspiralis]